MDTTKSYGFFLASFLVLMLLGGLTEACKCKPLGLRKACCQHDFVMRVLFMGVQRDPDYPYIHVNKFFIRTVQIFKASLTAVNTQFLYSPELKSYCGYKHKGPFQEDDYLISGTVYENHLKISMCSLAKPWDQISSKQKRILIGHSVRRCSTSCANL